ncbi:hypothetical protein PHLGIDRAFT_128725 [Phlebiopsis gigantea 11061_1 CR5-6]|uniref:Uncharacterized protein n=1 Tax=Phlebiopsis gigantea (strain 11061_1 CR5-6) TaxID=745531 RepID=A0A0C3PI95_PHLG1|nr:hypothetical protein PHLGIDRAFT_128725 [Phlebiopsis gigantea 11061_1 CR5-6]
MASYDERLLASAPAATRAAKQEGYNVDLLDDGAPKAGSSSPETQHAPLASSHGHAEAGLSKEVLPSYASAPVPWWRRKKVIIFAVIFAVVAVAAIVGGAVGGTVNHNKGGNKAAVSASATVSAAAPDTSSGPVPGQQGGGSNPGQQGGQDSSSGSSQLSTMTSASAGNPTLGGNLAQATKPPTIAVSGEAD